MGSGANNYVSAIAVEANRKIVIGGAFTEFNGVPRNYIARLNGGENFGPGEFVFDTANYSLVENATNITISVFRLIGTSNRVSVDFSTSDGTAKAGLNYAPTNGTLTFNPGETVKTFTVSVFDDAVTNVDRTVHLALSNPQNASDPLHPPVVGIPGAATLTIVDNDSVLAFAIDTYSVSENAGVALIDVQRLGGSVGTVTVDYATADGTATAGIKYLPANGTLVFTNGQVLQAFAVPIINEINAEGDQTVNLTLSNPTGPGTAALGLSSATLTIVDDDFSPGLIGFIRPNFNVREQQGSVTITVARSPGSSGSASVLYSTSDGTATNGVDYLDTRGTLVFADGEFVKSFSVPILNDNRVEPGETINLTLANPVGATLGQGTATITILPEQAIFNFSAPTYTVSEKGGAAIIPVLRTGLTVGTAGISYATSDGTAHANTKYFFAGGVLVFADGQTSNSFSVPIIDETMGEGNQTVNLSLLNPTNGTFLGPQNTAVLTIIDDEDTLSFSSTNYTVVENAGSATITVVRAGQPGTNLVTVAYAATNGTAIAGTNYTPVTGRLFFSPLDLVQSFTIPVIDDPTPQGDRTVSLTLFDVTGGGTLISPTNAILTVLDNDTTLSFSSPAYTVSEGGTNALITVNRIGGTFNAASVGYASSNITALAGTNYQAVSGVLNFAPGVVSQTIFVPLIDDLVIEGNTTFSLLLFNASPNNLVSLGSPSNAVVTIVDNDSSVIIPAGSAIVSETIPNGAVDPNEMVTINFGLRNIGNIDTINLRATLLATGGVINPSAPQSFGIVTGGGAAVSRPFTFKAGGTNGGTVTASFQLRDVGRSLDLGVVTFGFSLGSSRLTFFNGTSITINDFAPATPYPSTILVSNLAGTVTNVTASVYNLRHDYPADIDVLLLGPQGKNLILFSDAGGFAPLTTGVNLTFDDNATTHLTATDPFVSGTYLPSPSPGFDPPTDAFSPPAPPPPYVAPSTVKRLNGLLNGGSPNGVWSLFVQDDAAGQNGNIAGGWSLTIDTASSVTPAADLSVAVLSAPDPTIINHLLVYTLAVTNHGPANATGVILTNVLPGSAAVISCSGNCSVSGNVLTWNLGALPSGAGTNVSISVQPALAGTILNRATVVGDQADLNPNNNVASISTTVLTEPALSVVIIGNSLVISWPAAATNYNFRIEATDSLSPPRWLPVGNVQVPVGGQINILVTPTNQIRFYRLREP